MSEFDIGKSVRRIEDERFLKGQGKFVDDISLPGESFVFILRSTHPHAEILSMDVSKAIEAEGVLLVLTGEDVAADGLGGIPCTQLAGDGGWLKGHRTYQSLLVHKRVRHVGDRVAMVVAESKDQARNAAELIDISYDPMPFVSHLERAGEAKAPRCPGFSNSGAK